MKKLQLLFLLLLAGTLVSFGQPVIEWSRSFGGGIYDLPQAIIQTFDTGYMVVGSTNSSDGDVSISYGSGDCWIVKTDSLGILQWEKSYGGTGNDGIGSILQLDDGGYILAGGAASTDGDVTGNHGHTDFWIVRTDASGTILWEKSYGGSMEESSSEILATTDQGFIILGSTASNDGDVTGNHGANDYWAIKIDSIGTLQWQNCFGGSVNDFASSIIQMSNGNFASIGRSSSVDGDVTGNHGGSDYWVIQFDTIGNLVWQRTFGGSADDFGKSIRQTSDNGFIIAGISFSNDFDVSGNHGDCDYWIAKLDSSGFLSWQVSLGGTAFDAAEAINETMDGGFIISGSTLSNNGDVSGNHGTIFNDYWIVKISATGIIQWQECFGGLSIENNSSIMQTYDNGFMVCGASNSIDGDVTGNHGNMDFWIVKLGVDPLSLVNIDHQISQIQVSPNPFYEKTSISFVLQKQEKVCVSIYDINWCLVEIIAEGKMNPSLNKLEWNNAREGIYFLQIETSDNLVTQKIIGLN